MSYVILTLFKEKINKFELNLKKVEITSLTSLDFARTPFISDMTVP